MLLKIAEVVFFQESAKVESHTHIKKGFISHHPQNRPPQQKNN